MQKSPSFSGWLDSVFFLDAKHGWAVGEDYESNEGVILATSDGGIHWQMQQSRTDETLLGVAFPDATHGWVVGDWGTILATTTGGN